MPGVTKQTARGHPTANGRVPAKPGSLLSQGVPVAELPAGKRRSVLIYGGNRVGKTSLACQFPKPLALVTFEPSPFTGGAASVVKIPGVVYFQVIPQPAAEVWPKGRVMPIVGTAGAVNLADELMQDALDSDDGAGRQFRTVVIDGGTSLQDVALCEVMDLPQLPQQMRIARSKEDSRWGIASSDHYQDRSAKAKEVLRKFLNLPQHVVVLAKEKDHNPPRYDKGNVRRDKLTRGLQLESFVAADLGQATVGWLNDACDWITRLYIAKETIKRKTKLNGVEGAEYEEETGRTVRRLLMQLHPNFAAGGRAADPRTVPEYVEGHTPEEMYRRMDAVMRGEKVG